MLDLCMFTGGLSEVKELEPLCRREWPVGPVSGVGKMFKRTDVISLEMLREGTGKKKEFKKKSKC